MKLTLRREALASLDDADLAAVAGAQGLTGLYPTAPVQECVAAIARDLTLTTP